MGDITRCKEQQSAICFCFRPVHRAPERLQLPGFREQITVPLQYENYSLPPPEIRALAPGETRCWGVMKNTMHGGVMHLPNQLPVLYQTPNYQVLLSISIPNSNSARTPRLLCM